jgi:hypothetical protein
VAAAAVLVVGVGLGAHFLAIMRNGGMDGLTPSAPSRTTELARDLSEPAGGESDRLTPSSASTEGGAAARTADSSHAAHRLEPLRTEASRSAREAVTPPDAPVAALRPQNELLATQNAETARPVGTMLVKPAPLTAMPSGPALAQGRLGEMDQERAPAEAAPVQQVAAAPAPATVGLPAAQAAPAPVLAGNKALPAPREQQAAPIQEVSAAPATAASPLAQAAPAPAMFGKGQPTPREQQAAPIQEVAAAPATAASPAAQAAPAPVLAGKAMTAAPEVAHDSGRTQVAKSADDVLAAADKKALPVGQDARQTELATAVNRRLAPTATMATPPAIAEAPPSPATLPQQVPPAMPLAIAEARQATATAPQQAPPAVAVFAKAAPVTTAEQPIEPAMRGKQAWSATINQTRPVMASAPAREEDSSAHALAINAATPPPAPAPSLATASPAAAATPPVVAANAPPPAQTSPPASARPPVVAANAPPSAPASVAGDAVNLPPPAIELVNPAPAPTPAAIAANTAENSQTGTTAGQFVVGGNVAAGVPASAVNHELRDAAAVAAAATLPAAPAPEVVAAIPSAASAPAAKQPEPAPGPLAAAPAPAMKAKAELPPPAVVAAEPAPPPATKIEVPPPAAVAAAPLPPPPSPTETAAPVAPAPAPAAPVARDTSEKSSFAFTNAKSAPSDVEAKSQPGTSLPTDRYDVAQVPSHLGKGGVPSQTAAPVNGAEPPARSGEQLFAKGAAPSAPVSGAGSPSQAMGYVANTYAFSASSNTTSGVPATMPTGQAERHFQIAQAAQTLSQPRQAGQRRGDQNITLSTTNYYGMNSEVYSVLIRNGVAVEGSADRPDSQEERAQARTNVAVTRQADQNTNTIIFYSEEPRARQIVDQIQQIQKDLAGPTVVQEAAAAVQAPVQGGGSGGALGTSGSGPAGAPAWQWPPPLAQNQLAPSTASSPTSRPAASPFGLAPQRLAKSSPFRRDSSPPAAGVVQQVPTPMAPIAESQAAPATPLQTAAPSQTAAPLRQGRPDFGGPVRQDESSLQPAGLQPASAPMEARRVFILVQRIPSVQQAAPVPATQASPPAAAP